MTKEEFFEVFAKLAAAYPEYYRKTRADTISKSVANLPHAWFSEKAEQVIASSNPKFDWGAAASAYVRQQASERASKKFWDEMEERRRNCTPQGLPRVLKQMGATSLWDAVEKEREKGKGA